MTREVKYAHHSLNVSLAEKAVTDEVSVEAAIEIEFKEPLWSGPINNPVEEMIGVYCKTKEEADWLGWSVFLERGGAG